jgi:hypothetical protein
MKSEAILVAGVLAAIAMSIFADETITMTGGTGGRTISVTTNATRVVFASPAAARLLSVVNSGSAVVYAAPGVTSAEFVIMVAGTNATPVLPSSSYEFVPRNVAGSIVLQSASGTNSVTIGVHE